MASHRFLPDLSVAPKFNYTHSHTKTMGLLATVGCLVCLVYSIGSNALFGYGVMRYIEQRDILDWIGYFVAGIITIAIPTVIIILMYKSTSNGYGRDAYIMQDGKPAHEWHIRDSVFTAWQVVDDYIPLVAALLSTITSAFGLVWIATPRHDNPGHFWTCFAIALAFSIAVEYCAYLGLSHVINMWRHGKREEREQEEGYQISEVRPARPAAGLPAPKSTPIAQMITQKPPKSHHPTWADKDEDDPITAETVVLSPNTKSHMEPLMPKQR